MASTNAWRIDLTEMHTWNAIFTVLILCPSAFTAPRSETICFSLILGLCLPAVREGFASASAHQATYEAARLNH